MASLTQSWWCLIQEKHPLTVLATALRNLWIDAQLHDFNVQHVSATHRTFSAGSMWRSYTFRYLFTLVQAVCPLNIWVCTVCAVSTYMSIYTSSISMSILHIFVCTSHIWTNAYSWTMSITRMEERQFRVTGGCYSNIERELIGIMLLCWVKKI